MKTKILKPLTYIFYLILTINFWNCETEYYDGGKRLVLEGNIVHDSQPLSGARIDVYATESQVDNGYMNVLPNHTYYIDGAIGNSFSDQQGHISMSIPLHKETDTYILVVTANNQVKFYGYISKKNYPNYYYYFGTLDF